MMPAVHRSSIILIVIALATNSHHTTALLNNEEKSSYLQVGISTFSNDTQELLQDESKLPLLTREERSTNSVECCPTVTDVIEPLGGVNRQGMYVTLFRDGDNKQRFYEVSCKDGIGGKPCKFINKRYHKDSRCVQKYSYTNAIISSVQENKDLHIQNRQWLLDSIVIRSGCSCEVTPKKKRRKGPRVRHKKKVLQLSGLVKGQLRWPV